MSIFEEKYKNQQQTLENVLGLLNKFKPTNYDDKFTALTALHHWGHKVNNLELAFQVVLEFLRRAYEPNIDELVLRGKWEGLECSENSRSLGSIVHLLKNSNNRSPCSWGLQPENFLQFNVVGHGPINTTISSIDVSENVLADEKYNKELLLDIFQKLENPKNYRYYNNRGLPSIELKRQGIKILNKDTFKKLIPEEIKFLIRHFPFNWDRLMKGSKYLIHPIYSLQTGEMITWELTKDTNFSKLEDYHQNHAPYIYSKILAKTKPIKERKLLKDLPIKCPVTIFQSLEANENEVGIAEGFCTGLSVFIGLESTVPIYSVYSISNISKTVKHLAEKKLKKLAIEFESRLAEFDKTYPKVNQIHKEKIEQHELEIKTLKNTLLAEQDALTYSERELDVMYRRPDKDGERGLKVKYNLDQEKEAKRRLEEQQNKVNEIVAKIGNISASINIELNNYTELLRSSMGSIAPYKIVVYGDLVKEGLMDEKSSSQIKSILFTLQQEESSYKKLLNIWPEAIQIQIKLPPLSGDLVIEGFNDFNDFLMIESLESLKSFLKSEKLITNFAKTYLHGSVQMENEETYEWSLYKGSRSIFWIGEDKKGDIVSTHLSSPFMVAGDAIDRTTNKLNFALRIGKDKYIIFDTVALTSAKVVGELASLGVDALDIRRGRELCNYITMQHSFLKRNHSLKHYEPVNRTGWITVDSKKYYVSPFSNPKYLENKGLIVALGLFDKKVVSQGCKETFLNKYFKMAKGNFQLNIYRDREFSATLENIFEVKKNSWNTHGYTDSGKSVGLSHGKALLGYGSDAGDQGKLGVAADISIASAPHVFAAHQDGHLVIDDWCIFQNAKSIEEIAFIAATGNTSVRSKQTGGIRDTPKYSISLTSASEEPLASIFKEKGVVPKGGFFTRVLDIPLEIFPNAGILHQLNGYKNYREFFSELIRLYTEHRGVLASDYYACITKLVNDEVLLNIKKKEFQEFCNKIEIELGNKGFNSDINKYVSSISFLGFSAQMFFELGLYGIKYRNMKEVLGYDQSELVWYILNRLQETVSSKKEIAPIERIFAKINEKLSCPSQWVTSVVNHDGIRKSTHEATKKMMLLKVENIISGVEDTEISYYATAEMLCEGLSISDYHGKEWLNTKKILREKGFIKSEKKTRAANSGFSGSTFYLIYPHAFSSEPEDALTPSNHDNVIPLVTAGNSLLNNNPNPNKTLTSEEWVTEDF